MFAEDKVATRRRRGMVRACRKDKITLRKVKHAMNARVAISRRRDMVRAGPKKVTEFNPTPNTSTFFRVDIKLCHWVPKVPFRYEKYRFYNCIFLSEI